MTTKPKARSPRLYKVFISSTYLDNVERRKIVQDAITDANMVWHGMELFTASTRPTVEECKRHVEEADVLVGIIAWRYGWEPPGSNKSITEIEYDAARERLMFVLDRSLPVNPAQDYDQGDDRWKKQEKLEAFIKRFSKDQMPVQFDEINLGKKIFKALLEWREKVEKTSQPEQEVVIGSPPSQNSALDADIHAYCQKAESLHSTLPVAGFATQLKVPIDVEDIYIPLRAMVDLRGVADECFADADHADKMLRKCQSGLEISLPDAFGQSEERRRRGIVILGDPGAGKTTHLKRLLLGCLRKGPEAMGLPKGMLPVFLPLRELKNLDSGLDAFIQAQLDHRHLATPQGFGKQLLEHGNLLFLLDGLDEVADLKQREKVAGWIADAVKELPSCRFVVTCRFAGYSHTVRLNEDFLEMHIRPLSGDQVGNFVHNWYRIVERGLGKDMEQSSGIADEKADALINRLKEPDFRARRVFELTRNPLLLTNICLVHRHRGGLPKKRARLYEECIDVLLEHWRGAKGLPVSLTAQEGRRALQPAAYWLHGEEGRTRAPEDELGPHIQPVLKAVGWTGEDAKDFLRTIRDESGLLTGWDQENYGFMHLGFQEYLAAREIRTRAFEDPSILSELAARFGESWWQEVTLLMLALEDPSLFIPFMREVVKKPVFTHHADIVDACLDDAVEISVKPFIELLEVPAGDDKILWDRQLLALRLVDRIDRDAVDTLRSELKRHPFSEIRKWFAYEAVQREQDVIISDPGGYELVLIPGGLFMMGSPENEKGRYGDENPLHEVNVPDFYIGRYPVTNQQYELFLKEYPEVSVPKYWVDRNFNRPNQPVVGVSWDDVRRYAKWAELRLPTEAEWEYACRAGTTTRFYTGDKDNDLDRAGWCSNNSKGQTHPVGVKEPNTFGLYDMHGNVDEWTEDNWHNDYVGAPNDGSAWVIKPPGVDRVIRGGGWADDAQRCRSAFRDNRLPIGRSINLGFRLSRSVDLDPLHPCLL
jgi:formylglycine-generating enzyme required for sulfatase activity